MLFSIILLVISVVYLGYKFYQNFIPKKTVCSNCAFSADNTKNNDSRIKKNRI
jgi:hypothetical protein